MNKQECEYNSVLKDFKNLKQFAHRVNKKNFAEILQGWIFGKKERENAFAAEHFKSVFWPNLKGRS